MKRTPKIKALLDQINSGKMTQASAKILDVIIRHKGVTIRNIIYWTNIKESTVVARLSDMEDMGIIYKSGTTKEGNLSIFRYEPDPKKQEEHWKKRTNNKFRTWRDRGLKQFRHLMTGNLIKELTKPSLFQNEDIFHFSYINRIVLKDKCQVKDCKIGSTFCSECEHNRGIDYIDNRVKCTAWKQAFRSEKLTQN